MSTPFAVRTLHFLLWALVVIAAVSGPMALATSRGDTAVTPREAELAPPAVGTYAELFVAAYLESGEGSEDGLIPFTGNTPDLRGMKAGGTEVRRTATASVEQVGAGYWSVIVAAVVRTPATASVTRFFAVGVLQTSNGSLVVADLPAEVGGPTPARRPSLAGPTPSAPLAGDPLIETVAQFLAAYLTGEGSLSRYVVLDSTLVSAVPPPYHSAVLERIALVRRDPTAARVRAHVRVTGAEGDARLLRYTMELVERDGRWEVAALSGAPELAGRAAAPGGPNTSPPSTTPPFDPLPEPSDDPRTETAKGEPTP